MSQTYIETSAALRPAGFPRLQVVKGFDPMETLQAQILAPVASGVTIYSGQAVVRNENGEFMLPTQTELTANRLVAFAWQDSADTNVMYSGKLTAFPASGQFELVTPWFDTGVTFNIDDLLTVSVAAGKAGCVTKYVAGTTTAAPIVGQVTGVIADVGPKGTNELSSVLPRTAPVGLVGKIPLLRFVTMWNPLAKTGA